MDFDAILQWFEKNPGLAAWLAIAVVVLVAVVSWYAIRFETERAKNIEFNSEIDRIKEVISRFDRDLTEYIENCREYPGVEVPKPNRIAMDQLASMTVLQWPSVRSFEWFHTYWEYATTLLDADQSDVGYRQESSKLKYLFLEKSLLNEQKPTKTIFEQFFS